MSERAQGGNRTKDDRARNNPTRPDMTGGKRKAQEAAPVAAKRPRRQRKPKGEA
jgi:hypothetical protein